MLGERHGFEIEKIEQLAEGRDVSGDEKIVRGLNETFQDSPLWRKAHRFVLDVYVVTRRFPSEERYGLSSQLRRSSVSVVANFVEGFRRFSPPDKLKFYNIAQASADESFYYLILARDLGYIAADETTSKRLEEVIRMLHGYVKAVRQRQDLSRSERRRIRTNP